MEEKKKFIVYNGYKYTLHQSYYCRTIQLHRQIWIDNFGPIPKDHQIHHKNGNKLDNRLENLECVHIAEHRKIHNAQKEIQYQVCKIGSRLSEKKKRRYYLLKAGKNILAENSKVFWDKRAESARTCVICGIEYFTRSVRPNSGCCSNACRCYLYRLRKAGLHNDLIPTTFR